jgi:hypothetical protein
VDDKVPKMRALDNELLREILRASLQEEVVQLEAQSQEDKHSKRRAESIAAPVIGWPRVAEPSREDRGPDPPASLQSGDDSERGAGSGLQ